MANEVVVPRLGWSMDEGVFVEWLKQDGDWVAAGDMLFVVEGDKAAEEIESFDAGVLRVPADAPQPGDEVRVGQLLGYLVAEGESAPLSVGETRAPGSSAAVVHKDARTALAAQPIASVRPTESTTLRSRVSISPRARRVARELGVDWSTIAGTGSNGRIREQDIRRQGLVRSTADESANPGSLDALGQTVPITRFRQTIATRMLAGSQQAAPVTLTTKADATRLVELRKQYRQRPAAANSEVPSYTDLLVKLVTAVLQQHPLLKAQWRNDGLFIPNATHVAFAVDTELGLLAPVIHDVPYKTIEQVTAESQRLIRSARSGRLHADQLRGASFTITNLGRFGIDAFTPILHVPQSAILGVGRIIREPVVMADDAIVPREMVSLSLTFDHRVLDGAPAAKFLNAVQLAIARFDSALTSAQQQ